MSHTSPFVDANDRIFLHKEEMVTKTRTASCVPLTVRACLLHFELSGIDKFKRRQKIAQVLTNVLPFGHSSDPSKWCVAACRFWYVLLQREREQLLTSAQETVSKRSGRLCVSAHGIAYFVKHTGSFCADF